MSTQLILYPQNYQGYFSSLGFSGQEFLVDGQNFFSVNNTTILTGTVPFTFLTIQQVLNAQASSVITVNTWYRFVSSWGGIQTLTPIETASNLILQNHGLNSGISGVFQKVSNITQGANYNITIDQTNTTAALSYLSIMIFAPNNFTTPIASNTTPLTTNPIELNFNATSTELIVVIFLQNISPFLPGTVTISSTSLESVQLPPSEIGTDLQDGQVICDLYQEEDIPLTLSIDDFKNVAESVQSYSKDFDLPATKRNNRIFNNMFEITRSSDDGLIFNPYIKSKCVLKQDGFILFEGYLRLINVKDNNGEISYNVNLYSEVIALADVLKERTFSDLDLSELAHLYNKDSIKESWTGVLPLQNALTNPNAFAGAVGDTTTDVLAYPFIDWTHEFIVGGTNPLSNNATPGNPELKTLETAFRPCIKIKYLIQNIFANTEFRFTSEFFDTNDFNKLYMDFNWGSNPVSPSNESTGTFFDLSPTTVSIGTTYQNITLQNTNPNQPAFDPALGYNYTTNRFTALYNNTVYNLQVFSTIFKITTANPDLLEWRIMHSNSGGTVLNEFNYQSYMTIANNGSYGNASSGSFVLQAGEHLQYQVRGANSLGTTDLFIQKTSSIPGYFPSQIIASIGNLLVTDNSLLQTLRGQLSQWDFLKGIMSMFNLVAMVDESDSDNILIEPYVDIFNNYTNSNGNTNDLSLASRFDSKIYDWTEKISETEMQLTPLTDLNKKTIFKFEEDDEDFMSSIFKQIENGRLFGSKVYEPEGFDILEGEKEITASPFAATVSKALESAYPNFVVPSLYARDENGELSGFDNSPRILYNNGVQPTGASFYFPEQNNLSSENQPDYLQFSHLSTIPSVSSSTIDFHYQSLQLPSNCGTAPINNLFFNYWLPYLNDLYNADTRLMTLKVNLTPSDISEFKFYDSVMIKNRVFRVNKINYKPNSLATVEFILIP